MIMKRHLVIQLARFGDLLQSKRLLCSVASEPGDEVHLCLDRSLADLARRIFPHIHVHSIRSHGAGPEALGEVFRENRQTFGELQGLHFDTVYNLNFSGLNFALAALFEPKRVRGYSWSSGQPLKAPWTDLAFRWTRHRRISPLNLMDFWAFFAPSPMPGQAVNPPATPKGGGVGVAVAGRHSRRSLPPEAMAACVQAVAERLGGARIKLLGTKTEKPQAKAVQNALAPRYQGLVDDLTGKTDWNSLIETVGGLDVLLTPDTGVMHLAAHLGTPVEAFFLSSAWAWETGPYGSGHKVFQAVRECAPCIESQPCPYDVACLEPFRSRAFLRIMSGRVTGDSPEGILGLKTGFDPLGVVYEPEFGLNASARDRRRFRELLGEYLAVAQAGPGGETDDEPVRLLYRENDWMLHRTTPKIS